MPDATLRALVSARLRHA